LLERNASFNLTGARDLGAVSAHIADALTIAPFIAGGPLIDIGSGGGMPAIPLGIACDVSITLVESTLKKARFLEEALQELKLSGEVVAQRAEVAAHDACYRERYIAATARAVGKLTTVLELTLPFLDVGGRAVLQRGALTEGERKEAALTARALGGAVVGEERMTPARWVVLVEKRDRTPQAFPRRTGVPARRPLTARDVSGAA